MESLKKTSINELLEDIKSSIDLLDKLKAVEIEDIEGAYNKINNTASNIYETLDNLGLEEIASEVKDLDIDLLYDGFINDVKISFLNALEFLSEKYADVISKKYVYTVIQEIEKYPWDDCYQYDYIVIAVFVSYDKALEYVAKHRNKNLDDIFKIKRSPFIE